MAGVDPMYIRFVSPWRCVRARAETGLFGPAYSAARAASVEPWMRAEIRRSLDWFSLHLAVPWDLSRCGRNGVCWFRDQAGRHVSEARYLAWLIGEAGLPIAELRMDRPGTVIWQDDHQVVALPERNHPRLFAR